MNRFQRLTMGILTLAVAGAVGAGAWWLVTNKPTPAKTDKAASSADVKKVVNDDDLNTVTLSEKAETRIGLTVAAVAMKPVRRVRVYGGEVMVPIGRTILVAAPLAGQLSAPSGGVPKAGQVIRKGDQVFELLPLLTPDAKATLSASLADADGQVDNAKTQMELTRIALERAKRVLKQGAGSQRLVDEAQAGFDLAAKSSDAMVARRAILAKVVGSEVGGTTAPIVIDAPENGFLRVVSALAGQTVPTGAALFEIVDLSTLWVRVPLPVGDLDQVDGVAPAQVGKLSGSLDTARPFAKPILAPPSANPLAATVDLFYEMPHSGENLTPGQRLGVTVPLKDEQESLTVPWSAVIFDVHGGTWVFVQKAPHVYMRHRVEVRYTIGDEAVLKTGPAKGTLVVTNGVQELFGAATGFIK